MLSYNGRNGSICDDSWDKKDGDVLCRQLGFGPALEVSLKSTLQMEGFFMDDMECFGNESNVLFCQYSGWDNHNCNPDETASVQCEFNGKCLYSAIPNSKVDHSAVQTTIQYNTIQYNTI